MHINIPLAKYMWLLYDLQQVQGATDAAKNAADLILTEPGLSPIYGAVLESRRIFSRIKCK